MAFPNLFSKILPLVPMTGIYPSRDTALQAAPLRYKRATNLLIFSNLYPRSTPSARRDAGFYIVLNISKNLRIPRIRTSFFQIKVGTLLHGTLRPFGSEPTTPLTKDTSATLAAQ